ncbi:transcriptional regulator [Paractinoplanes deccanensis]|uniref:Transcriptional regulator n=1 Tax=Paractinoplanes deccanensis TaxID=113561 RepID=A0ABQ3YF91_9ACTN|nr:winged helix-turn-helix domain-containing protein [Actinoplanes deccanensis]GID78683.1 transcriptional regulator [Actinoplanes deccanensis]
MLRLLFEPADRGRVIFDIAWHAETIGSVQALRQPVSGPFLDRWRQTVRPRVPGAAAALFDVIPAEGLVPDFLTPEGYSGWPTDRFAKALRATGTATACGELRGIDDAHRRTLAGLADALEAYHRICIAPTVTTVDALLRAELAHRAGLILTDGVDAALATLGPDIRWTPPVLEVRSPAEGEVRLGGRGLRLVPSVFWSRPGVIAEASGWPTLTYPIHPAPATWAEPRDDPLAALVGPTRARVLRALVTGRSTTELARDLRISAASASGHVTALRAAGLAATRRAGRAVRHTLTPLGLQVLASTRLRAGRTEA